MLIFIVTDDWLSEAILKHKKDLSQIGSQVEIVSSWQLFTELCRMQETHAIVLEEASCFATISDLLSVWKNLLSQDLVVPFVCPNRNFSQ